MAPAASRAYRIYGLTLRADRRLPHLVDAQGEGCRVVAVRFATGARPDSALRVRFGSDRAAIEFAVDRAGTRIWVDWSGDDARPSITHATTLLAGPVLGGVLRLRGTTSLHGCAVAVDGAAIVLLGAGGAGKSTLAAALAQRGHPVLADDVVAIGPHPEGFTVQPGYPCLRLTHATIEVLRRQGDPPRDAGPVLAGDAKRFAALSADPAATAWRFSPEPVRLRAVYVLTREPGLVAPRIGALGGAERLTQLVRHLRTALWPLTPDARAAELARLARLAASIPIYRLACPDAIDALAGTCGLLAGTTDVAA